MPTITMAEVMEHPTGEARHRGPTGCRRYGGRDGRRLEGEPLRAVQAQVIGVRRPQRRASIRVIPEAPPREFLGPVYTLRP